MRMDVEMQKTAWLAANIMNVHTKRRVTVDQLLGKSKTQTQEDKVKNFELLKQKLQRQRAEA